MIPFNQTRLPDSSLDNLLSALKSGQLQGDSHFSREAERVISEISGLKISLLTASCTQALELASILLGVKAGDEIIMPAFNFTSSATAIANYGATPVFVDIDSDTLNISAGMVEAAITKRTKGISVVNYAGIACDFISLREIANKHNLYLIEDNAHGFGGNFNGTPLGSFGDISAHSFHETKNIQCGEGGFIAVNNSSLVGPAQIARDKGSNRREYLEGLVDKYTWQGLGGSYLLAEPLAALLLGQLEDFKMIQENRVSTWNCYFRELSAWASKIGIELMNIPEGNTNIAHIFYLVTPDNSGRTKFIEHMNACGVDVRFHYQSLDRTPAGLKYGIAPYFCTNSHRVSDNLVRLPLWFGMDESQINQVLEACLSFKL